MKTNLSRPLISYLTREIEKGDITRALLWANEYRENDPYFVQALYTFAEKTGRLNQVRPELQQQLLKGQLITHLNYPLVHGTGNSAGRRPRAPSLETLESRFGNSFHPVKSAKSK